MSEYRTFYTDDDGVDHDILNLLNEMDLLRLVNDGQALINAGLRLEVKRLRQVDAVLKDFNFQRSKVELALFAREGFDEVVASRKRKPYTSKRED